MIRMLLPGGVAVERVLAAPAVPTVAAKENPGCRRAKNAALARERDRKLSEGTSRMILSWS
jgi:hypothetical protein